MNSKQTAVYIDIANRKRGYELRNNVLPEYEHTYVLYS
jgi:hypothetical protein